MPDTILILILQWMRTLITNANIVNEGKVFQGDVLINGEYIEQIGKQISAHDVNRVIDAKGSFLLPGAIDDQVHFREPGLTHKGTIYSESRAAVAGGVTSFMEMPNTNPPTFTQELLEQKYAIAARTSLANYSFFIGASNDNLDQVLKTDLSKVCVHLQEIFWSIRPKCSKHFSHDSRALSLHIVKMRPRFGQTQRFTRRNMEKTYP
jgi:dihydroorotase-like cyclic amidohydrolase